MNDASMFEFTESDSPPNHDKQKWKVLTVEDDPSYQQVLIQTIKTVSLRDHLEIEIFSASSVSEAAYVLSQHKDIAIVFIDVVMETDDAGLRLVDTIRNVVGNSQIRIVLLTGQPSFAPQKDVMKLLDIDEYWNKADLSAEKLHSVINSNLRTYKYIQQIENAKQGLQLILDAARSINGKHDIVSFSQAVLHEISRIIQVTDGGGILFSGKSQTESLPVLSTSGCFKNFEGHEVSEEIVGSEIFNDIQLSQKSKSHCITEHYSIFFFDTHHIDFKHYVILVKTDTPISEQSAALLQVFSENVGSGFSNIALLNRLTELAYTNISLNLPNRNWLQREIEKMNSIEINQAQLIIFEIQDFDEKAYALGFQFCKKILLRLVSNIKKTYKELNPRVSLFKDDSIAVILPNKTELNEQKIALLKRQVFEINNVEQFIDVRVLVLNLSQLRNLSSEKMLNLAESALSNVDPQENETIFFTSQHADEISSRFELMQKLRHAIADKDITVAFQPKIDLVSHQVVGFEALARWKLKDGTFVSPDEFISLAETSGLITELDNLIFTKILEAIKVLNKVIGSDYRVAFNASILDLVSDNYISEINDKVTNSGLKTSQLELEVTETQAIHNYERVNRCLEKFVELGFNISIDDFGTGYSSLEHISEIPASTLKIDRCFVNNLEVDSSSQHIVNMIMMLADTFEFDVVAEGVETAEQAQWLANIGCKYAQGYYFAKPMFIDELIVWLEHRYV